MALHSLRILVLGLVPIALTACVSTEPATAQPTSAVPAIGVDLGNSARVPQIAGLAGEGEGYGRAEAGTTPTAHGSIAGMSHETGMQMDHGSMSRMNHGSTSGAQMDHDATMDHGAMGGMQMDHRAMPGMRHGSKGRKAREHDSTPGMSHGSTSGMQMDHGSMSGMSRSSRGGMQMAHAGHAHAQGTGTVNSVDAAAHKVNVSHGPIPTIGRPAMTMDFAVAPSVDLQAVKPGTRIKFTIEQGEGGIYVIQSILPAGGGR
jgi:Cu/Ag efflux protein CusF